MPAITTTPAASPWRPAGQDATGTSVAEDSSSWSAFDGETEAPSHLGGVRLLRQLGQGGMGRVYLGHHPILDIQVAVKVMLDDCDDRERFLNEMRLAARVDDEHLVRVLHAGDENGALFLVMEYVAGRTLRQLVQEQGRLPWREAAQHILQAARGLAAVHRHGIIHRDVKPSNMLLDTSGRVKVSDLGVARTILGPTHGSGHIVGTPAYMAPEQAREPHCVTASADVYGLGASLYYLIAGENPFPGLDAPGVLAAHRSAPVPNLRRRVPGVPDQISELVRRMMAKDPIARPMDGAAVVGEIERILGMATVSTTAPSAPPPAARSGRSRRMLLAGISGAVLIGAVLLGSARPEAARPGPPTAAAVAPPPAIPVPVPAAADTWQTPPRAVFVLEDHLPATARAAIDEACRASRLPVIERQRIDALVHEQDLVASGRVDPATAGRIAHLVGGHIAIFANGIEDRVEVRTVLVETGEVVSSRLVAPADAGTAAAAGIAAATALLQLQGRVDGDVPVLSAGARHGVHAGDRLELRRAPDAPAFASAVVTTVERDRAVLEVTPAGAAKGGVLAVRTGP